jgi:hypothetical protein
MNVDKVRIGFMFRLSSLFGAVGLPRVGFRVGITGVDSGEKLKLKSFSDLWPREDSH